MISACLRRWAVALAAPWMVATAGCGLVPKDVLLFTVESDAEFFRASLHSVGVQPPHRITLRWVDDNTWQTKEALTAPSYKLITRAETGEYFEAEVIPQPGQRRYRLKGKSRAEQRAAEPGQAGGQRPLLSMEIPVRLARLNGQPIHVVATGSQFVMQTAYVGNNRAQVRLPAPGRYALTVHVSGEPPLQATFPPRQFDGHVDLGLLRLEPIPDWGE